MPITYTPSLVLSQIPVGTDGATANNERNTDMTKIDALFATNTFTSGSIIFANASGKYTQDNANLFWDDTNNRLGIGTSSPLTQLHISSASTGAVQIRLSDTTTPSDWTIRGLVNLFDIDAIPGTVPTPATVRFFRSTTLGAAASQIQIYTGVASGTPVVNAVIGGNVANTYFCADNGSMGVGTNSINTCAIFEVASTTKGMMLPRMTTTQRDAIPSILNAILIYNTTTNKFQGRAGGAWVDLH